MLSTPPPGRGSIARPAGHASKKLRPLVGDAGNQLGRWTFVSKYTPLGSSSPLMAHPLIAPTRRAVTAALAATMAGFGRMSLAQTAVPAETLRAAMARIRLRGDQSAETDVWTINGQAPGRPIRMRQGQETRLKVINELPLPLAFHWHGLRGANETDGVGGLTQDPIAPGGSFEYRLMPQEAGTFLVRPCVIGGSAELAERGLQAVLIAEEAEPPKVDYDLPILIDDWRLNDDGSLAPFGSGLEVALSGRLGNLLTVNGAPVPAQVEVAPGARVRLRLVNACNARVMRLRFDDLRPYVVAVDSHPTDKFEPLRSALPFAPGTRYDLILDMPDEAGVTGKVTAMVGEGVPLVTLVTAGQPAASARPALPPLGPLPPDRRLPAAIKLQNATRKDLVIRGSDRLTGAGTASGGAWKINGTPGSRDMPPLLTVKRDTPVVLTIRNETPLVQCLHLHGHAFRLLHAFDDGWEPYWLDTLQVPENRTVRIAFQADNPGRWLLASTVLERFDAGLWTWVEVT